MNRSQFQIDTHLHPMWRGSPPQKTVEARLSILTEAGYYHHWSGGPDSALTYFRQAEALTGLAEALVGTAPNANPVVLPQALDYLEQARTWQEQNTDEESRADALGRNLLLQAQLHVHLGQTDPALILFDQALQQRQTLPGEAVYRLHALDTFTGTLLDHQHTAITLALLEKHLTPFTPGQDYWQEALQNKRGWCQWQQGLHADAQNTYNQLLALQMKRDKDAPYRTADTVSRLLVIEHAQAGGGPVVHPGAPQNRFLQLQTALEQKDRSLKQYLQHLDCACTQDAAGFRKAQSEAMRAAVQIYAGLNH